MKYFFILGHQPALSASEIISVLREEKIFFKNLGFSREVFLIETDFEFNASKLLERLGGTIKIGIIKEKFRSEVISPHSLLELIVDKFTDFEDKKIYFGISLYSLSGSIERYGNKIQKLGLEVKKLLKEKGKKARLVTSRERFLSSVIVGTNKLLTQGGEIVIISDLKCNQLFLGKTLAIQEFSAYSLRDYGRPSRDARAGMIPPKLAKIMINLAKADFSETILDPFCGTGTIIQEALLIGYRNFMGTDISEEAVRGTQKNLDWLINQKEKEKFLIGVNITLKKLDVRRLSQEIFPQSIGAIITEPYLGPPSVGHNKEEIEKNIRELINLYLSSFREFKKVLKPQGRVVMVWPVFKIENKLLPAVPPRTVRVKERLFLPIIQEVKNLGFKFIPYPLEIKAVFPKEITFRGSLIYSRPDQHLEREIWVLE